MEHGFSAQGLFLWGEFVSSRFLRQHEDFLLSLCGCVLPWPCLFPVLLLDISVYPHALRFSPLGDISIYILIKKSVTEFWVSDSFFFLNLFLTESREYQWVLVPLCWKSNLNAPSRHLPGDRCSLQHNRFGRHKIG